MQHVVFWSSQSAPAFERVHTLADAVELVQRLRNDHDVTDAEVHTLTEVPLNFRTVVLVEPALSAATLPEPPALPPVPRLESSFAAFGPVQNPTGYAETVPAFGTEVPGVVPDPIGLFTSLAVVGAAAEAAATEEAEAETAGPHLVGLPAVAPDDHEAPADELSTPTLHALAEAVALAESEQVAADAPMTPARSLGLFA